MPAPFLLLLAAAFTSARPPAPERPVEPASIQTRWVSASGDGLSRVAGYYVVEYRDAGEGGMDWTLMGSGQTSGNGTSQLWLFEAPLRASTALTTPSEAVAFMMAGDHNDGYATFLVDGTVVGTFDMYRRGERTLVVEGLPRVPHVLEVVATGQKAPASRSTHIALYGGAALDAESVASFSPSGSAPARPDVPLAQR